MENIEQKISKKVALKQYSTFKIGGAAEYYIEIKTRDDLAASIDWAVRGNLPFFILSGGSNILFSDQGFPGLVIKMKNCRFMADRLRINCESGVDLWKAVKLGLENSLSGLEWAYGIPGTVGGAVRGNAGAFGSSMKDVVADVEAYDALRGKFMVFEGEKCHFSYRDSVFKHKHELIIWSVKLLLEKDKRNDISKRMREFGARRTKIQPCEPSAGSIFKNLMFEDLKQANPQIARAAQEENAARKGKVGTGWLIDRLGLKGKSIGGAKISEIHANFIVNTGSATAEDVIMLISYIKQQARDSYGIQLHEEIVYAGF